MTAPWIAAFVALSLAVVMLGVITLGTLRRVLPVLGERPLAPTLPQGAPPPPAAFTARPMPPFSLSTASGGRFTDMDLSVSGTVLLFLDSACRACDALAADLEAGNSPNLDAMLVVVATDASQAERFARGPNPEVLIDGAGHPLASSVGSDRFPDAFVIRNGWIIDRGNPNDWAGIRALAAEPVGSMLEPEKERIP